MKQNMAISPQLAIVIALIATAFPAAGKELRSPKNVEYKECLLSQAKECFEDAETANYPFVMTAEQGSIKRTKYSFLLIHGLSDSPYYLKDFTESISEFGYNIIAQRNTGHGTHIDELESVSYKDWLEDADEGYKLAKLLGEKVIVVGFSTGAPLALYLHETRKDVGGAFFLAPALKYSSILGFGSCVARVAPGSIKLATKEYGKVGGVRYQGIPLGGVCELSRLVDYVEDTFDPKFKVPIFMMASLNDDVTNQVETANWLKERMIDKDYYTNWRDQEEKSPLSYFLLEGKIIEEELRDFDFTGINVLSTPQKVTHSGVMLKTQGFGGASEVNPYFSHVERAIKGFVREKFGYQSDREPGLH